ncbi:hypothetical protein [Microtetraspora malaysiensis]|uniref:hypothetical protein n=1 Tax=Microtetraspora malaysiensis TaxID=161358 RepID=UPI003D92E612
MPRIGSKVTTVGVTAPPSEDPRIRASYDAMIRAGWDKSQPIYYCTNKKCGMHTSSPTGCSKCGSPVR